jgi:hypothetical protein
MEERERRKTIYKGPLLIWRPFLLSSSSSSLLWNPHSRLLPTGTKTLLVALPIFASLRRAGTQRRGVDSRCRSVPRITLSCDTTRLSRVLKGPGVKLASAGHTRSGTIDMIADSGNRFQSLKQARQKKREHRAAPQEIHALSSRVRISRITSLLVVPFSSALLRKALSSVGVRENIRKVTYAGESPRRALGRTRLPLPLTARVLLRVANFVDIFPSNLCIPLQLK